MHTGLFLLPGLTGILIGLTGLTAGISFRDRLRSTELPATATAPGQLWTALLCGSILGILLTSFFLFPGHGLLFAAALLASSRISALQIRM